MAGLAEIARKGRAWGCYDCGKCTGTCPIARVGGHYSPRRHVLATTTGRADALPKDSLFACLTCSLCETRCPVEVAYTDLVRSAREVAFGDGVEPECPHGGALQSVMRMMARGGPTQDRLAWLDKGMKTARREGEVLFWTGCAVYYDAFFQDLGVDTLAGIKAAVKLMNAAGVTPVVSGEERCCGHDLLWNGDRASFEALARYNTELVARSGATTLVTSCAECLRTWRLDYAPFFTEKPPRILHLTEFLLEHRDALEFKANGGLRFTYQDPCRLGRHLGVYWPPRQLLGEIPGLELAEMPRSGPTAACCAGGTWSSCDRYAKRIQVERLREARGTGAEVLVTACPKCQIHFRCAMNDPNLGAETEIEMRDVAELVADALR